MVKVKTFIQLSCSLFSEHPDALLPARRPVKLLEDRHAAGSGEAGLAEANRIH